MGFVRCALDFVLAAILVVCCDLCFRGGCVPSDRKYIADVILRHDVAFRLSEDGAAIRRMLDGCNLDLSNENEVN